MEVIQKFLLILVLMDFDGSFTTEEHILDGACPPKELIIATMMQREDDGDFESWDGYCSPLTFRRKPQKENI